MERRKVYFELRKRYRSRRVKFRRGVDRCFCHLDIDPIDADVYHREEYKRRHGVDLSPLKLSFADKRIRVQWTITKDLETARDIATRARITPSVAQRILNKLMGTPLVVRQGSGTKKDPYRYARRIFNHQDSTVCTDAKEYKELL